LLPPPNKLQWAKDVFENMGKGEHDQLKFTKFSNKVRIVLDIVKEAIKLKENVLVFVHSIPTLDYLEEKLKRKNYETYVLTGKTPMETRQVSIDRFSQETGAVYLISCKVYSVSYVANSRLEVSVSTSPPQTALSSLI
jgi:SNF2 family DNA or RNA helicase